MPVSLVLYGHGRPAKGADTRPKLYHGRTLVEDISGWLPSRAAQIGTGSGKEEWSEAARLGATSSLTTLGPVLFLLVTSSIRVAHRSIPLDNPESSLDLRSSILRIQHLLDEEVESQSTSICSIVLEYITIQQSMCQGCLYTKCATLVEVESNCQLLSSSL